MSDPVKIELGLFPTACLGIIAFSSIFGFGIKSTVEDSLKSAAKEVTEDTSRIAVTTSNLNEKFAETNKSLGEIAYALKQIPKEDKQPDPKAEIAKDVLSLMERADDGSSITVKTAENGARVFVVRSGGKIYEVSASTGKKMAYPKPELK